MSKIFNVRYIIFWPVWLLLLAASLLIELGMTSSKLGHTVVSQNVSCSIVDTYVNHDRQVVIRLNCNGTTTKVPYESEVLAILLLPADKRESVICNNMFADASVDSCAVPKVEEGK